MNEICRRHLPVERRGLKLEKRAENQLPKIHGTAAVYFDTADRAGTQYQLWDNTFERILPGAFDLAVTRDDVRGLQNHDPRMLLGRNVSGTLALSLEKHGLDYVIDTPETQVGRDTVISLERGDMTGSSFSFRVSAGGAEWSSEVVTVDGVEVTIYVRNVKAVELFDVGPVTYPAYLATNSGTRGQRSCVPSMAHGSGEFQELRTEFDGFLRQNFHEPEARERLIVLARAGAR